MLHLIQRGEPVEASVEHRTLSTDVIALRLSALTVARKITSEFGKATQCFRLNYPPTAPQGIAPLVPLHFSGFSLHLHVEY